MSQADPTGVLRQGVYDIYFQKEKSDLVRSELHTQPTPDPTVYPKTGFDAKRVIKCRRNIHA